MNETPPLLRYLIHHTTEIDGNGISQKPEFHWFIPGLRSTGEQLYQSHHHKNARGAGSKEKGS
jgi:hypothetical protein